MGWIGVDLDGTLAYYDGYQNGKIGAPIAAMVERVKKWRSNGQQVKIVTARANPEGRPHRDLAWQLDLIREWCKENLGEELPITCSKDFEMIVLWDDRVRQVEKNTGREIRDTP